MKIIFVSTLFLSTSLLAQKPLPTISPVQYAQMQELAQAKEPAEPTKKPEKAAATKVSEKAQMGIMIIPPDMRAKDISEAFNSLKQANPAAKIMVKLVNGTEITDILSIDTMTGGTMLIFRINSMQGMKVQVVKIEEIDTIGHV